MDAIEHFAAEAAVFEAWVKAGNFVGESAVRKTLIRITRLYLAALDLPTPWTDEAEVDDESHEVDSKEWQGVFDETRRLPFEHYGVVFDPMVVPPEEPVVGDIADDIADIYRDVIGGLRAYRAGKKGVARWEWGYTLANHWGEHATGAIRALHCWLTKNSPSSLASSVWPGFAPAIHSQRR